MKPFRHSKNAWPRKRRLLRRLGTPPIEDAPPVVVGPAAQDLGPGDSPLWPSAKHMGVGLFPALQRFPQASLHQDVHAIEDEANPKQQAGQPEHGPVVYGGIYEEGRRDHDTEDGE